MKTIPEGLLDEIVGRLVDEFDPEQIILFGSHAWGVPQVDSDLDLLVLVQHSDVSPVQRDIQAHLRMLDIPVPMDIMVNTIGEFNRFRNVYASLEAHIDREGKVLYERSRERGPVMVGQGAT
jgi:predicted nucleotidyltransferase